MTLLPQSAAYRIALISALAFALATMLLGAAVYYAAHEAFVAQMDAGIAQASDGLLAEWRDDGVAGVREAVRQREAAGPDALGYAIFDPAGRRIGGQLDTAMPSPGWQRIVFRDPDEGADPARAKVTILPGGYRLVVAADLEPLERIDETILTQFGIAFLALLIIGIVGGLMLGAYLKHRLTRIDATARAIIAGDLSRRADIGQRGDEFDRVSASLNAMLDRIEALVSNLRQVTSDLAHDLRTPLTRLRQRLEGLGATSDTPDRIDATDAAIEQCDDVLRLFDAILRISELEQGSLRRHFAPVDLGIIAADLAEAHESVADEVGRTLSTAIAGPCIVYGDRELLSQAVINLIENALRHTPPGTAVTIGTRCSPATASIFVADQGQGIAPSDRTRVTERFVRLETARSTPGHGLGLSLVAAIARAHGGTLALDDANPGLVATISLPRSEEDA